MKKKLFYALFLGFLAVTGLSFNSCSGNASDDGKNSEATTDTEAEEEEMFVSKDGQFKAFFPGEPQKDAQMVATEAGDIEMISFVYEKSATEASMIAYSDYPSSLIDGQEPMTILGNARDGSLEGNFVESNDEMKVNGWPAIRTKAIDKTQNLYYVLEVILAKNRLYQLLMVRDGSYPTDDAVEKFMDTFEITMKK
ncbi:MAG: hypothetical protein A2W93_16100 [Bacteroidetes bacterium GWF2_43_63]|nr:MAG: hypothetical protein A2W94_11095 [Bacteroidetes bacterium GWE2_42_42]OFY54247.1 MAG: hypothetical protein A2W93_16100 [Bacteroidetes bacterium GWF2_43_63]HBG69359.1 hypothetical protein [Bacteroidales bacterium]HCB60412.1 hypothetical protein [Bacteroidales bacterium]HCY23601.1 hypothetical protein [Bacteroidales bacterium]